MGSAEKDIPWHKQFWPWFIIALPACVVVASIITVIIAFRNQDGLVADDYYKDGLAINQVLARDKTARRLALGATVVIDALVGELMVSLQGDGSPWPARLVMDWFHPTDQQQDFSVELNLSSDQNYLGQLPVMVDGRWYVRLSAEKPEPWRLKTDTQLDQGSGQQRSDFIEFSLGHITRQVDGS